MQEFDAKCFQGYKLAKKEDKDSGKNKFIDILFANTPSKKQQFST